MPTKMNVIFLIKLMAMVSEFLLRTVLTCNSRAHFEATHGKDGLIFVLFV